MICLQFHIKRVIAVLIYGVFITAAVIPIQAQQREQTVVKGTVLDKEGKPLHLAHVMIEGTSNGDVTNREGRFQIEVFSPSTVVIIVSMVGYTPAKEKVNLQSGKTIEINFQLQRKETTLDGATVTADAFTTGNTKGVTLSPTEVVTTPGAAADIFRALKTFPGVSNIDEGSGLFVRGGDVSEVSFLLDQAPVVHPYKYESPTGGVFGTIPPFLVSGTHFSTGGFSAKYGNALSAVLDMQSEGMPDATQFDVNVAMGAISAGGAVNAVPGNLGIHFSGNRSLTGFMFGVNGLSDEFEQIPMSRDGNLSVIVKPYNGTTIKFFNYVNNSEVGVRVSQPSFEALFQTEEQNRLHNLQWKQLWGNWLLKTSFSVNRYRKNRQFGILDLDEADRTYKVRSDIEFSGLENMTWYAGLEWERFGNNFSGQVPGSDDILDPSADYRLLDERYATRRLGGYIESAYRILLGLRFQLGLRADYENVSEDWTVDPRVSLQYDVTSSGTIRLASGRYHQYAEPFEYNAVSGNPNLDVQQSWHYIAGYEFKKDLFHIRAEGYYKSYDDLIIEGNRQNLSNRGYGEAYGADFFFKYSDYLRTPFNGWISYSLLHSKRLHPRQAAQGVDHEYAPSAFDITHNLNIIGKAKIIGMLSGGLTYRYSTGRPFTPIVDAQSTSENYYLPVEGQVHSQRLPDFHRLDLNLSYYWVPVKNWSVIFYTSVSNVLDRRNVMDYTYNNDYSERTPIYSDYSRFVYAGVTVNVQL